MPRVTLGDIKASRISEVLNIPPDDTRLPAYVNEAIQRLLNRGHWWGTMAKYSFYSASGYITLPPQVATVEKVALSNQPVPVRDFWYEFIDFGWGTRTTESGTPEALFSGRYPIFSDIAPTGKKVIAQCDLASDVGKEVLILGFDDNNNWIRTTQGGVISDGEVIVLAQTPGTTSVNNFSSVTDIQAPDDLDGQWWLYEWDTVLLSSRMIGHYQYTETRPSYARYLFPSIGTTNTLVEALVKLDFVPVKQDSDYSLIGCIPALKKMAMAIRAEEENRFSEAIALEAMAVQLLDQELSHYLGDGRTIGIQVVNSGIGEAVETFV